MVFIVLVSLFPASPPEPSLARSRGPGAPLAFARLTRLPLVRSVSETLLPNRVFRGFRGSVSDDRSPWCAFQVSFTCEPLGDTRT